MIVCIIGASSGCGKTSIAKELLKRNRIRYIPWLMYTTRPIRNNESNGIEYHFITDEKFRQMNNEGLFIENREYQRTDGSYIYATRKLEPRRARSGIYIFMEQTLESAQAVQDFYSKRGIKTVNFLIYTSNSICMSRILQRNDGLSIEEAYRRLSSDSQIAYYPNLIINKAYKNELSDDFENIVEAMKKRIDMLEMMC